jgi:pyruvate/2-oxoacid:ferredoxin oxidoreductase alpha subunit
MKRFITGNHAVAEAVRLARTQLVAAYPITPQTPIYEKLSDWESNGELGGVMMRVESEHSALASCLAASLTGVRTFTATSSQGMALMHEILHYTSGCRAPVVMACVNRTLAAPWAFWSDQTDSLSQRDTGWIQIYCEDGQEALDSVLQAFCLAEKLLLPCMVVLEANYISHFVEPVDVPEQDAVDHFMSPVDLPERFDVTQPGLVSPIVNQRTYFESRRRTQEAMDLACSEIASIDAAFKKVFGRGYGIVEAVETKDAELVLVTSASITSTARLVIQKLRQEGRKVGLLKIRVFRPFPSEALREIFQSTPRIVVIDRNISLGREGIFCSELKAALANSSNPRWIQGYLAGIGGTNVGPELIERILKDAFSREGTREAPIWMMEA